MPVLMGFYTYWDHKRSSEHCMAQNDKPRSRLNTRKSRETTSVIRRYSSNLMRCSSDCGNFPGHSLWQEQWQQSPTIFLSWVFWNSCLNNSVTTYFVTPHAVHFSFYNCHAIVANLMLWYYESTNWNSA